MEALTRRALWLGIAGAVGASWLVAPLARAVRVGFSWRPEVVLAALAAIGLAALVGALSAAGRTRPGPDLVGGGLVGLGAGYAFLTAAAVRAVVPIVRLAESGVELSREAVAGVVSEEMVRLLAAGPATILVGAATGALVGAVGGVVGRRALARWSPGEAVGPWGVGLGALGVLPGLAMLTVDLAPSLGFLGEAGLESSSRLVLGAFAWGVAYVGLVVGLGLLAGRWCVATWRARDLPGVLSLVALGAPLALLTVPDRVGRWSPGPTEAALTAICVALALVPGLVAGARYVPGTPPSWSTALDAVALAAVVLPIPWALATDLGVASGLDVVGVLVQIQGPERVSAELLANLPEAMLAWRPDGMSPAAVALALAWTAYALWRGRASR